jgi:hypothetical protein
LQKLVALAPSTFQAFAYLKTLFIKRRQLSKNTTPVPQVTPTRAAGGQAG